MMFLRKQDVEYNVPNTMSQHVTGCFLGVKDKLKFISSFQYLFSFMLYQRLNVLACVLIWTKSISSKIAVGVIICSRFT